MFSKSSWISRSGRRDGKDSWWKFRPQFLNNFYGIDGEPFEFGWNTLPRLYVIGIASRDSGRRKAQKHWSWKKIEDRIIFMSMFNGIDENTMNPWFSSNSWISAFFQVLFRVRIDCMVNSAAVSFRFQAITSIPTFNSRHRATCTSCRIFQMSGSAPVSWATSVLFSIWYPGASLGSSSLGRAQ